MSKTTSAGDELRRFAASTTAHGFGKLNHPISIFRAVWTVLILGAACAFTYSFILLFINYLKQPVSVSIDPRGAKFEFPDVTVCAKNAFAISRSFDYNLSSTQLRLSQEFNSTYETLGFLQNLAIRATNLIFDSSTRNAKSLTQAELLQYSSLQWDTPGIMVRDTTGEVSFNTLSLGVENLLLSCRYGSLACEATDLVTNAYSGYSNCFTFSLSHFKGRHPNTSMDEVSDLNLILFTDYVFPSIKIRSIMRSLKDKTLGMQSSPAVVGFVHRPGTYPTSGTEFEASGLMQTTLSVRHTLYEFVSTRDKPCESENTKKVNYDVYDTRKENFARNVEFVATREDCVNRVTQKKIFEKCHCINSRIPIQSDMVDKLRCGNLTHYLRVWLGEVSGQWDNFSSIAIQLFKSSKKSDLIKNVFSNLGCMEEIKPTLTNEIFKQDCTELCNLHKYSVSFSSNAWPTTESEVMEDKLDRWLTSNKHFNRNNSGGVPDTANDLLSQIGSDVWTLEHIYRSIRNISDNVWKNFVSIRVRIDHPTGRSELVKQKIDYSLEDLVSDVGGILGLYLGVSVLTLCEVVELLLTLAILIKNWCKHSTEVIKIKAEETNDTSL